MQNTKKQNGITLIALVITIIVMMILVGVSVTVALNGGLFSTAKKAAGDTEAEKANEQTLASGRIKVGDVWYDSLEAYERGEISANQGNTENEEHTPQDPDSGNDEPTPTEWTETTKEGWSENVKAMTDGTNIIPLPEGYSISKVAEEQTVDGGLVITDGTNEFVWITVKTDFTEAYSVGTDYSEPTELTDNHYYTNEPLDSQTTLNYCYGEGHFTYPETVEEKANVNNTFAYVAHYAEMVESVNKYDGFYIGRYETTIDGSSIGSKKGATVLTVDQCISQTNNKECGWWGLYASQRNSNVAGNGTIVQTNMIWGQQWEAMITYFGSKDYSNTPVKELVEYGIQNAGQVKYTYKSKTISDEICNIFDLRRNVCDCTAEVCSTYGHTYRGRNIRHECRFSCYSYQRRSNQRNSGFTPVTLHKIVLNCSCLAIVGEYSKNS